MSTLSDSVMFKTVVDKQSFGDPAAYTECVLTLLLVKLLNFCGGGKSPWQLAMRHLLSIASAVTLNSGLPTSAIRMFWMTSPQDVD